MDEEAEFDEERILHFNQNFSSDYFDDFDTSEYYFPNTLWHIKPPHEIAIKTIATLIVGICGIYFNLVILIILFRNKWLWSASNYLIGNLALTDLLALIFCPWFMLVRDFYQNYVLRGFGCYFEGFLQATLLLASVGAILLVSYDRLAAAGLPVEARITKKAVPKLFTLTWFIALIISLPWIVFRDYVERQWLDYLEMYCVEDVQILGIYWHLTLSLLVWIPIGVMLFTYGTIMWRLEWSVKELTSRGGGRSVSRARGRAMRISACILLTAVVCRLPYTILIYWRNNLSNDINSVEGSFDAMWFVANYLMYVNSAINPLIYGFTNARFRKTMDRTPGVSCFKFGSWCCACTTFKKKPDCTSDKNTEKIFVIENSPRPHNKIARAIKTILHINKDTLELSVPKVDEGTTKPTKETPMIVEHI